MIITEGKKIEIYTCIHQPIIERRIAIQQSRELLGDKNADSFDSCLYSLDHDIWEQIKMSLHIRG